VLANECEGKIAWAPYWGMAMMPCVPHSPSRVTIYVYTCSFVTCSARRSM
jgi:hypothetical protein